MTGDDAADPDADPYAQMARIIHSQMNIEPRRMHLAIELAKKHLDDIRRVLVERGLRTDREGSF
jgi:hypothetical protein